MKAVARLVTLITFLTAFFSFAKAQNTETQSYSVNKLQDVKDLITSRDFIFEVQTILPFTGSPIIVTPDYTLSVTPDKIVSRLPYFGRAYVAPLNPDDSGIEFNSGNFIYNTSETKNGWLIQIKPDMQKVQQMTLTVSDEGYANLTVISSDRQQISYRGIIKKHKERSEALL